MERVGRVVVVADVYDIVFVDEIFGIFGVVSRIVRAVDDLDVVDYGDVLLIGDVFVLRFRAFGHGVSDCNLLSGLGPGSAKRRESRREALRMV